MIPEAAIIEGQVKFSVYGKHKHSTRSIPVLQAFFSTSFDIVVFRSAFLPCFDSLFRSALEATDHRLSLLVLLMEILDVYFALIRIRR